MRDVIPRETTDVIIHPYPDFSQSIFVKGPLAAFNHIYVRHVQMTETLLWYIQDIPMVYE